MSGTLFLHQSLPPWTGRFLSAPVCPLWGLHLSLSRLAYCSSCGRESSMFSGDKSSLRFELKTDFSLCGSSVYKVNKYSWESVSLRFIHHTSLRPAGKHRVRKGDWIITPNKLCGVGYAINLLLVSIFTFSFFLIWWFNFMILQLTFSQKQRGFCLPTVTSPPLQDHACRYVLFPPAIPTDCCGPWNLHSIPTTVWELDGKGFSW